MQHVLEHVPAVKGHHWDEVGEPQQNVHPHQPKQEIGDKQQPRSAKQRAHQPFISRQEGLFKRVDGDAVQFEGNDDHAQHVEGGSEYALANRAFPARGQRSRQTVDTRSGFREAFNAQEGIAGLNLERFKHFFAPPEFCIVCMFVPQNGGKCFSFAVLVPNYDVDGFVGLVMFENDPEVIKRGYGRGIDGKNRVPGLHPSIVCSTSKDNALDVDVVVNRYELRSDPAQQQHHDHRCENIGCRPCCKHTQPLTTRSAHQFLALWLSKGAKGQRAQLQQTERLDSHAMSSSQQAVPQFVNHQRHHEGHGAPAKRDHRVETGHRHQLARRGWVGRRRCHDGGDEGQNDQQSHHEHRNRAHPEREFTVKPPEAPWFRQAFKESLAALGSDHQHDAKRSCCVPSVQRTVSLPSFDEHVPDEDEGNDQCPVRLDRPPRPHHTVARLCTDLNMMCSPSHG